MAGFDFVGKVAYIWVLNIQLLKTTIMKKAFFLLLFAGLAELLVGQNHQTVTAENLVIRDDMSQFAVNVVPTETSGVLRSSTFNDMVWRPLSEYTIFDSGLNLSAFEKEVQIRYQVYEIAAESAISGDTETEGIAWFVVQRMTEPDFMMWYTNTFPAMLEILSMPESTSKEDIGVAEKAQRLKKRLFPARE